EAAPAIVPLFVEVHDEVQSPVPPFARVVIEIDVWTERLALTGLVRASAEVERVVQQAFDARDTADIREEGRRLDDLVEAAIGRTELRHRIHRGLATRTAVVADVIAAFEGRELAQEFGDVTGLEEIVDHDMAEGKRARECLGGLLLGCLRGEADDRFVGHAWNSCPGYRRILKQDLAGR